MSFERPARRQPATPPHAPERGAWRRRRPADLWESCESRLLLATGRFNFSLSIADAPPVARPDQGFALAAFTVSLSPANIESPITVDYTTVDGDSPTPARNATAANGDYIPTSGTLTIPTEGQSGTIYVKIPAKTQAELTKTFYVDISNPTIQGPSEQSVGITNARGVGTIVDTHPAGQVQFSSSVYEVNPTDASALVTITRTGGRASDVAATFTTTTGGTAVPNADYTPVTRQVTFGLDQQTATVAIPINAQELSTQDLTVNLLLENPSGGATLGGQSTATLVIHKINPLIVTTTADDGVGSLRRAIAFADSAAAPVNPVIRFAIVNEGADPHTITPVTRLPELTRPMTIDATTQPGYVNQPVIVLNGSALQRTDNGDSPADGLDVAAGGSTVIGLAIGAFPGSGIVLEAPGYNRLLHNVIGADPSGGQARPNLGAGVFVDGSPANTIAGNLISGNGNVGVQIFGPGASGNVLSANKIGTNAAGAAAVPNLYDGVFINNAPGNTLVGNLISGNRNVGVQVYKAGATGNIVLGNVIGANLAGAAAVPNTLDGVFLNNAPRNLVAGNLISGNGSVGLQAFGPGTTGNAIVMNKIGTDATGSLAIANVLDGVFVNNAPSNVIGNNLISGNGSVGVQVFGAGSTGDAIRGNVIGLGAQNQPLGNNYGVFLNGAPGPGRGGPEAQNVIRGNRIAAVFRNVTGTGAAGAAAGAVKARAVVGVGHPRVRLGKH